MATSTFDCPIVGESVQVLAKREICKIEKVNLPSHQQLISVLCKCSSAGKPNCPVSVADPSSSDVEGFPYSGTDNCAYLKALQSDK